MILCYYPAEIEVCDSIGIVVTPEIFVVRGAGNRETKESLWRKNHEFMRAKTVRI